MNSSAPDRTRLDRTLLQSSLRALFALVCLPALIAFVVGVGTSDSVSGRVRRRHMKPRVNPKFHRPAPKGFRDRSCFRILKTLKVRYRRLKKVRGVTSPIQILGGRIGRIKYRQVNNKGKMILDCRLAVALQRASPLFHVNGVKEVLFSNFYSWRRVDHSKRLSRHALGLAIDIDGFKNLKGRVVKIRTDYQKGLGKGRTCEGRATTWSSRMLRDLVCDLDSSNLFDRILTPDYDRGHRDHLHISTFHPLDRRKTRIYRTVLVEVRGNLWPWAQKRPRRANYRRSRISRIVRNRSQKVRRWYKWMHRRKKAKRRRKQRRRR